MLNDKDALKLKLAGVMPHLNEKKRRILAAAEAQTLGYGGFMRVSEITGLSCPTLYRGLEDLKNNGEQIDTARVRKIGGGRKKVCDQFPDLLTALAVLIEPNTRGDPESQLRWTCKSVRTLGLELRKKGFIVNYPTVASLLHKQEYSLQAKRNR